MLTQSAKLRLIRLAQKFLDKKPSRDRCGYYNGFYKLTENIAIKTRHGGTGDSGMEEQVGMFERAVKAHSIGCGPYAFGLFYHAEYGLCYMVEIVTVFEKLYPRGDAKYKNDYYKYNSDHARTKETILGKRVNHVIRKMHFKIGFSFRDAHSGNLAVNSFGAVVCIDFDDFGEFNKYDLELWNIQVEKK